MLFVALDSSTFVPERVGKSWERCKPILINRSTHDFVTNAGRSCFGGPVAERRTERASVAPAPVPGPLLRRRTAIWMGWPFLDRGRCTTIFRSWILCCSLLVSALQSNQCQWIKHYHFLKFLSRFYFTLLSFPRRHRIAVKSKNIDGSRVKGDRKHEFCPVRHKRYFRGHTRAFELRRRTLNVRRRGYEGLYRRHWLSVEKTHVAREERNAPTSWRKSWSVDLQRSSKWISTRSTVRAISLISFSIRRACLNHVACNAYKVDPRMDHFPWVESVCRWTQSIIELRFTDGRDSLEYRSSRWMGARSHVRRSPQRHGWMTVRKRFVGRWHKVQCPPVKCTTHDALTESIGKSVNLLFSYTEHKRNIRARGNRTGKIDFFRPFLRFPHTHTVDAI